MRNRRVVAIAALSALLWAGWRVSPSARESNGTAAAKALVEQGETAARAGAAADAIAAFRKAIDADPDFVEAHQRFIELSQRQEMQSGGAAGPSRLQQQYERWAREHPKSAVYQWALGVLAAEPAQGDTLLAKALALDPAFARAHFQLAKNADQRGDTRAQLTHLKAAVDGNPDEPRYLVRLAHAQRKSDPVRFRELASQVVARFPTSPYAAEALNYLAAESSGSARRGYFDRLRSGYPADRFSYSASAMNELYAELTMPAEALALAREMAKALPANKTWPPRVALQDAMARAQTLIAGRQFAEALAQLEKTERPSGNHGATWTLLKAEAAAGAGNRQLSYTTLVDSAAASPDVRVDAALATHGGALGKQPRDIAADVWKLRDTRATPASPFAFPSLRDGKPVQLADFRGRVVLVAFWYPT
jgi:tetratricopeptide (TPR) repeat protein